MTGLPSGDHLHEMETIAITCPSCFETFEIPSPSLADLPAELDYDCEVCCRPMVIAVWAEGEEVFAEAQGLGD